MWVVSKVGEGSHFHFTAVFGRGRRPSEKCSFNRDSLAGVKVLVVDDNETNRFMLKEMLQNWNMEATLVAGGAEAMDELNGATEHAKPFPIVLLDAMMPGMDGFELAGRLRDELNCKAAMVLLSSARDVGLEQRCRQVGIDRYLTKPIKQSQLLDAIADVLGLRAAEPRSAITVGKAPRSMHVLLVEDGRVNQQVAANLLKHRGHSVEIAENGEEAVRRFEDQSSKGAFDVILMDVQMPVMDGFQATAAIRERESGSSSHIPIIATTAHAMKGDREKCLEAGMDGYIAKPLNPAELYAAIEGRVDQRAAVDQLQVNAAPEVKQMNAEKNAAINFEEALERISNQKEILQDLVRVFRDECPSMMDDIRRAIAEKDAVVLRRSAHTMKSSLDVFSAKSARELALELEMMGQDGKFDNADGKLQLLDKETARVLDALNEIDWESQSG
jgi:CheY-like chemotaxis protein/HPt (histidine-containing phosphotransfer) domain-containing protein